MRIIVVIKNLATAVVILVETMCHAFEPVLFELTITLQQLVERLGKRYSTHHVLVGIVCRQAPQFLDRLRL